MRTSEGSSTAKPPRTSRGTSVTSRHDGFRLTGPSVRLDPRIHAFRPDIADIELAGTLFAPHYARAQTCCCTVDMVMVRATPSDKAPAVSQLVHGETFAMVDKAGGWAWGRCGHDDYVGYVPAAALGAGGLPLTQRVTASAAPVFSHPSIKAPILRTLPIGARLGGEMDDGFFRSDIGYLHYRHLAALDETEADPVGVAERLIGSPYRWGGRGGDGIDCSGLVQRALEFAGVAAPRDSDMQRDQLGDPLPQDAALRRGDLVFFPGHVGLMADETRLLHANAFWMTTLIEPLADVVARLAPVHAQPIVARRRLPA